METGKFVRFLIRSNSNIHQIFQRANIISTSSINGSVIDGNYRSVSNTFTWPFVFLVLHVFLFYLLVSNVEKAIMAFLRLLTQLMSVSVLFSSVLLSSQPIILPFLGPSQFVQYTHALVQLFWIARILFTIEYSNTSYSLLQFLQLDKKDKTFYSVQRVAINIVQLIYYFLSPTGIYLFLYVNLKVSSLLRLPRSLSAAVVPWDSCYCNGESSWGSTSCGYHHKFVFPTRYVDHILSSFAFNQYFLPFFFLLATHFPLCLHRKRKKMQLFSTLQRKTKSFKSLSKINIKQDFFFCFKSNI